jgi:hypothetical protein
MQSNAIMRVILHAFARGTYYGQWLGAFLRE